MKRTQPPLTQPSSPTTEILNVLQKAVESQADCVPIPGVELSIIVPTFNERDNVTALVQRLEQRLRGRSWEVIFVDDDSPDLTADVVREMAQCNGRVRCLHMPGRDTKRATGKPLAFPCLCQREQPRRETV
jgi:cellulose synthase/poly-beta-1,6-N-acetylglucosamine synthase-like glycosyltransferase